MTHVNIPCQSIKNCSAVDVVTDLDIWFPFYKLSYESTLMNRGIILLP